MQAEDKFESAKAKRVGKNVIKLSGGQRLQEKATIQHARADRENATNKLSFFTAIFEVMSFFKKKKQFKNKNKHTLRVSKQNPWKTDFVAHHRLFFECYT